MHPGCTKEPKFIAAIHVSATTELLEISILCVCLRATKLDQTKGLHILPLTIDGIICLGMKCNRMVAPQICLSASIWQLTDSF